MAPHSGAHITGAHCSVDYDFSQAIAKMTDGKEELPALATLLRPYRQPGFELSNVDRLRAVNA